MKSIANSASIRENIKNKEQCPCGSERQYRNCCKKKGFLWYRENGEVFREIPFNDDVLDELSKIKVLFKEIYGQEMGGDDLFFFFIYNSKRNFDKHTIRILRNAGASEEYIYAYTQTGLLPTEINQEFIPDKELKQFSKYMEEYQERIQEPITSNKVDILAFVAFSNDFLNEIFQKLSSYLMFSYNYFIRTHLEERKDFFNYRVQSCLDFGGLCAIKTLKNMESIEQLKEYELEENILATSRFIFESYLYMVMLNQDTSFFQKYIINDLKPKRMDISTMSKRSIFNQDEDLYNLFFKASSKYVHLDILTAQSYFRESHPFEEVNRSLVASIIGIAFSTLTLEQISSMEGINMQFKQDVRFMTENAKQDLIKCFEIIKSDSSLQDEMYSTFISRLREKI